MESFAGNINVSSLLPPVKKLHYIVLKNSIQIQIIKEVIYISMIHVTYTSIIFRMSTLFSSYIEQLIGK